MKSKNKILILKSLVIFISLITFSLCVHLNYLCFIKSYNFVLAILFSISFVGISLVCFEFALLYFQKSFEENYIIMQIINFIIALFLIAAFIVMILFNVNNVLNGQYNNYKEYLIKNKNNNSDIYSIYKTQEELYINSLKNLDENIKNLSKSEKLNDKYIVFNYNKDRKKIDASLDKIQREKIAILKENKSEENIDYYSWLSSVFGKDKQKTQLIIQLLGSVILELSSAISIANVIFYKGKI